MAAINIIQLIQMSSAVPAFFQLADNVFDFLPCERAYLDMGVGCGKGGNSLHAQIAALAAENANLVGKLIPKHSEGLHLRNMI